MVKIFNSIKYVQLPSGYYIGKGNNKGLHVAVWEHHNGRKVPKGYVIHHLDHDKENNSPENLVCITRKEHAKHHPPNTASIVKAMEAAKKWHGSEVGRQWHSEKQKKYWEETRGGLKNCDSCGKLFHYYLSTRIFCSPKCQQKANANETRDCEVCGSEFITNKYKKAKTCSRSCRNRIRTQ